MKFLKRAKKGFLTVLRKFCCCSCLKSESESISSSTDSIVNENSPIQQRAEIKDTEAPVISFTEKTKCSSINPICLDEELKEEPNSHSRKEIVQLLLNHLLEETEAIQDFYGSILDKAVEIVRRDKLAERLEELTSASPVNVRNGTITILPTPRECPSNAEKTIDKKSKILLVTLKQQIVVKSLGQGAYGTVHLVEDRESGRRRAVKDMQISVKNLPDAKREDKCLKLLNGRKYFLRYFGACFQEIDPEILRVRFLMEYFQGQNLSEFCLSNTLSVNDICTIMRQIGEALIYIHKKNIMHLDVKSENILINSERIIKLIDFGVAQFGPTHNDFCGTWGFAAPEVMAYMHEDDAEPFGFEADYFSLGATLHDMLFGSAPDDEVIEEFESSLDNGCIIDLETCVALPGPIDSSLHSLLNHLLHPNPKCRLNDETFLNFKIFLSNSDSTDNK